MKILIAGIGNIFHGDDAFGVEVAHRLARRPLPPEAQVVDFGIRGIDLAFALLDGYDAAILVDAAAGDGEPGTLYTQEIDPQVPGALNQPGELDPHGMNPMRVLQMAQRMGGCRCRVLLVGCQPETLGPEEGSMGLSSTVAAAVDRAADMAERLVNRLLQEQESAPRAISAA